MFGFASWMRGDCSTAEARAKMPSSAAIIRAMDSYLTEYCPLRCKGYSNIQDSQHEERNEAEESETESLEISEGKGNDLGRYPDILMD